MTNKPQELIKELGERVVDTTLTGEPYKHMTTKPITIGRVLERICKESIVVTQTEAQNKNLVELLIRWQPLGFETTLQEVVDMDDACHCSSNGNCPFPHWENGTATIKPEAQALIDFLYDLLITK